MSSPTRYNLRPVFIDPTQVRGLGRDAIDSFGEHSPYPHNEGGWVKWQDYELLQAENKRLVEAGDSMAKVITEYRCSPWGNKVKDAFISWNNWHIAKKGFQPWKS